MERVERLAFTEEEEEAKVTVLTNELLATKKRENATDWTEAVQFQLTLTNSFSIKVLVALLKGGMLDL